MYTIIQTQLNLFLFFQEILNNTNFFTMLSILNKNHETWRYYLIYSTEHDQKLANWNLQTSSAIGDYFPEENLLRNYLNYSKHSILKVQKILF